MNSVQHLVCFFLLSADASFIPVHRMGFSGGGLIKNTIYDEGTKTNENETYI
jgi:hypothetical protein